MAEDRNTEQEDGQERPPRPVTAAARRERRASVRPAARKDSSATAGESSADTAAKSSPKGKTTDKDRVARRGAKADGETGRSLAADAKGRPTRARDDKVTRVGLLSRLVRFLREVVAELRKVIWPTRKQMITYTSVVLVFLAVLTAMIAGMDLVLAKGVLWLFG